MLQQAVDKAEMYYGVAQIVDAQFFRRLNNQSGFDEAVNAAEDFINKYGLNDNDSIPLSGLQFRTSSKWRIHRLRDFTALANCNCIRQLQFSFGEKGGIKLEFNGTPNQPGNARLSSNDSFALNYEIIFQQGFFLNLSGDIISELIRKSRTSGRPITCQDIRIMSMLKKHDLDVLLFEDVSLDDYAAQLNHFMLLLDFEIARHLQVAENKVSKEFNELPVGVGIAILSVLSPTFEPNRLKDYYKSLFCYKDPNNRKEILKRLISIYVEKLIRGQQSGEVDRLQLEGEFFYLLKQEFSSIYYSNFQ